MPSWGYAPLPEGNNLPGGAGAMLTRPFHQDAALIEVVSPSVGELNRPAGNVVQRGFSNLSRRARDLGAPSSKVERKPWGFSSKPRRSIIRLIVASDMTPFRVLGNK